MKINVPEGHTPHLEEVNGEWVLDFVKDGPEMITEVPMRTLQACFPEVGMYGRDVRALAILLTFVHHFNEGVPLDFESDSIKFTIVTFDDTVTTGTTMRCGRPLAFRHEAHRDHVLKHFSGLLEDAKRLI